MTATLKRPSTPTSLERLTRLVDQELERALPPASLAPRVLHEAMRYCLSSGGKRFRPLLCLSAAQAAGTPPRRALSVACAIELIHTYSLVHDDLPAMDNADLRRGQPTCHRRFGEGNAVLVGDALLTLAFEWLSRDGTPNSIAIIRLLGHACGTGGLIGGQVLDLQVISQPRGTTEQALRDIAERKTAALISASVVAGGLIAGAPPSLLKRLQRFGERLGLAFQLIDDLHDGDGLVQVVGAASVKAEAEGLIDRALDELAPCGRRAGILRELAVWLRSTA